MTNRRVTSKASLVYSGRGSRVRRALYEQDLDLARRQSPAEKLKTALELSELCFKLKRAIQTAGSGHGKS